MQTTNGFTLIEALVSLVIIGVVGFILADLMTRSFQGSSKTALLGTVKQNGQTAMNILDSKIRNADLVLCSTNQVLVIQDTNSNLNRFYFGSPPTPTSLSQDSPTKNADPQYDPTQYCNLALGPATSAQSLTDTSAVSIIGGKFDRNNQRGFKDSITISFKVVPANAGIGFSDQLGGDGVLFQTTINLR